MLIDPIIKLVPPPTKPTGIGPESLFEDVERKLGFKFPPDYREFCRVYGKGQIRSPWESFWILNALADDFLNVVEREMKTLPIQLNANSNLSGEDLPFCVFPSLPGLIPLASSDGGFSYYWLISSQDRLSNPLFLIMSRSDDYQECDGPFVNFFERLLSGDDEFMPSFCEDEDFKPDYTFVQYD